MSVRVQVAVLTAGWLLAAVTLWKAGAWSERIHRYDECVYVANLGPAPFWACPAEKRSPARPARNEGEGQA